MAKKMGGIVKLKVAMGKLQRTLSARKSASDFDVPGDVKEGHFAVIAADDDEVRRFIVPLSCLARPAFLRLLEDAAEEFGFDHKGALMVPCRPTELERMLTAERWAAEERNSGAAAVNWGSYKAGIWSC